MAMIFPGMDPYLEEPQVWPGVHTRFIVYLADFLQARLPPRYVAGVNERVYLEGPDRNVIPDSWVRRHPSEEEGSVAVAEADAPDIIEVPPLEVHESYVEILDLQSGQQLVTAIELLSPTNKYRGPGRVSYLTKQRQVLRSRTHLVEIDLLRRGPHVLAVPRSAVRARFTYHYLCCVNRATDLRQRYEVYPRQLPQRLPRIRIPLGDGDPDVILDIQTVLAQTYDAGHYLSRLRYDSPCRPALPAADQAWANERIREARQAPPTA